MTNKNLEPLVSVLCLAYNQKDFIKDTIEGFLIQKTSFPIEVIIHDDASTDGTDIIIKEYADKYPNLIKPILQKENQYSQKVDIGAKFIFPVAKGKYVAICEGDDYWIDPMKLQKQVDFLEQNIDYGLVYTDINKINRNNEIIYSNFMQNRNGLELKTSGDYLVAAPFVAPCTWVFRKDLYVVKDRKYIVGDLPMFLDIVFRSKIHMLKEVTTHYRVLENSASHFTDMKKYYSFMKGIYDVQIDYAKKYNVSQEIINRIHLKHATLSYNFAISLNDIEQVEFADKTFKENSNIPLKLKVLQIIGKNNIGRNFIKKRLIKKVGFLS